MANVTFRHAARHLTIVDVELEGAADEAHFLLTSDEHIDNKHCLTGLLKKHLTMADDWDGTIFNGDTHCLMQGKYDPRADRSQLRPELQGNNYFDAASAYVADFLEPHAKKIILLGKGNHETNVLKRQQIDMTERLVGRLNDRTGSNILCGGYSGWVFFRMNRGKQRYTIKMYRHHGFGGGAMMTAGVLDTRRMAAWQPDANIIVLGHKHTEYVLPVARQRINSHGTISYDEQLHVRVPGYLAGMEDGYEGWPTERGFPPTTAGAMKLTLGFDATRKDGRNYHQFVYDVSRLK
jgi:hypothetical protein